MTKKERISKKLQTLKVGLVDDSFRYRMQLIIVPIALGIISFGMFILNIFTNKYFLMIATFLFSICCALCALGAIFLKGHLKKVLVFLTIIIFALFTYFIVFGGTEGFSTIWILLLPSCGMIFWGYKLCSKLCLVMLLELCFFFWTDLGQSLLVCTEYTESFLARFPIVFVASYIVTLFLEFLRVSTQEELQRSRQHFKELAQTDGLTGLYNRSKYMMDVERFKAEEHKSIGAIYLDLNGLKQMNDTCSHKAGDRLIMNCANLMREEFGEKGSYYRIGGDEFLVLLLDYEEKEFHKIVMQFRDMVLEKKCSVSIGESYTNNVQEIVNVIKKADIMMMEDKKTYYQENPSVSRG